MASRGTFRAIHGALLDDPDFQTLSSQARHTLLTARLCPQNTIASIFRWYSELLCRQTGYAWRVLDRALRELAERPSVEAPWIVYDKATLWIRNGLRYDPTVSLADSKHRIAIERAVAALPKTETVLKFCDYYRIPRPFEAPREALPRASISESVSVSVQESEGGSLRGEAVRSEALMILERLNTVSGRAFRPVPANLRLIMARLKNGATVDDCLAVIDQQAQVWRGNAKMWPFMRPATLFNDEKFEQYLGRVLAHRGED